VVQQIFYESLARYRQTERQSHGRAGELAAGQNPAVALAYKTAGIAHRRPHDPRHHYASVKIAEGVPVTAVAAQLGHAKKSLTLETYSHVLLGG
jgi:integrase